MTEDSWLGLYLIHQEHYQRVSVGRARDSYIPVCSMERPERSEIVCSQLYYTRKRRGQAVHRQQHTQTQQQGGSDTVEHAEERPGSTLTRTTCIHRAKNSISDSHFPANLDFLQRKTHKILLRSFFLLHGTFGSY